MSIVLCQAGESSEIQLEGELDIAAAAELKGSLLQALELRREIRISVGAATSLDVTAFQLLWSAAREATRAGLRFVLTGVMSELLRRSLEDLGLVGLLEREIEEVMDVAN